VSVVRFVRSLFEDPSAPARLALEQRVQEQDTLIAQQHQQIEQLAARIESLRATIKAQQAEIERLRRDGKRQAAPFSKGSSVESPKTPGRKPGQGTFNRRPMPCADEVSQTLEAPLGACPECGQALEALQTHEHFQTDLPLPRPVTTRFVTHSGYCGHCQQRVHSRHPQQVCTGTGAAGVGLGPNVRALAADMKHRLGVPYAKIAEFLQTACGLSVTPSALCQSDARLAIRTEPVYQELILALRECKAVFSDETGWRLGVLSAWLWTFTSQRITVYVIDPSRSHAVIVRILGQEFEGVLHSDCFLAYDHHALDEWLKQKCLGHLLKDLSQLERDKSRGAIRFPRAVAQLLREALAVRDEKPLLSAEAFLARKAELESQLDRLIDASRKFTDKDNRRMAKRLRKQREHLFTFLSEEGAEATNNRAERALRPAVISRKTGGCNKGRDGGTTHAVLSSVSVTARQQEQNPVLFFCKVLTSAKAPPSLVPVTVPSGRSP
jgi:transposase